MKKIIFTLFLSFISISNINAQIEKDLIARLEFLKSESYQKAIKDLDIKEDLWKEPLSALYDNKSQFIVLLKQGDKGTVKKVASLFEKLDKIMLKYSPLNGQEIYAVERVFKDKARQRMGWEVGLAPSNFQNNSEIPSRLSGWNNSIISLTGFGDKISSKEMYRPEAKVLVTDLELHPSGKKLMYSSIGDGGNWHLFEYDITGNSSVQLTPSSYEDFDSFDGIYTPDGKYIFCATATFLGLPCTNGGNKMCGLFSFDPKTGKTRQLTFDQDSNWGPVMLSNGQVMYQRWEYADLPHSNSRYLFTMNPDGTNQIAYYGSGSYFPTSLFYARSLPGDPTKFVGIVSGHHSVSRTGRLMLFDTKKSREEAEGVVCEMPSTDIKVEPIIRDRLPDGVWPQFTQPYPINDKYFIVSAKLTPSSLWGIYLVDIFGNVTLVKEEEDKAFMEPTLIAAFPEPSIIPDRVDLNSDKATVFIQDIYFGRGLKDIPKGEVKRVRVGSFGFSPLNQGGLLGTIGLDGPWDIRRILGEVAVEEDGSVMFEVPANTAIFLQPLDSEGKALQTMRSWFTAMPGETVSCLGCHENRDDIPSPKSSLASKKRPQKIEEFYGPKRGFSFVHEVQPVLDRACVVCHSRTDGSRPYFKRDSMINDWSSQISGHGDGSYAGKFSESYFQLSRYVRRTGIESDIKTLSPMDVHADQTELMQIINRGHYGVKLTEEETRKLACWIDLNAPYHGRRGEIPNFPSTIKSYQTRDKYLEMLSLKAEDLEWLPEIQIKEVEGAPQFERKQLGDTAVEGWPHFKGNFHEAWSQIGLGVYKKDIVLDEDKNIRLHLIKIPSGKFIMGSGRNENEKPQTIQNIEKSFWMGQFEITNEIYSLFDKEHDSRTEYRHGYQFGRIGYPLNDPNQPVVRISWEEAMAFCKWLSEKTGLKFTLPTESQWEWACRSGSDKAYPFGELGCDFSNYANVGDKKLAEYAACTSYKNYESTRVLSNPSRYDDWVPRDTTYSDGAFVSVETGRYRQNFWDLYDMNGNVWEWTRSQYKDYPYADADGRNDIETKNTKRTVRGGSWYDRPHKATSSYRMGYRDYQKVFNVGFRVVLEEE